MIDLNWGSQDDNSHAILIIGATVIKMIKFIAIVSRKLKEEEAMRKYLLYVTTHTSSIINHVLNASTGTATE